MTADVRKMADVRRYVDVKKVTSDVRRYFEGAVGNLSPSGARDMAKSLVDQAQGFAGQSPTEVANQVAGQVREIAQQLMEWSQQNRSRVMDLIQREVKKQLATLGIATKDDIDALRKRVRDLEKSGGSPAKKATTKRSTTKKTAAKRTSAKTTASRSSGSSSGGGSASASSTSSSGPGTSGSGSGSGEGGS
jgi:BMFP domain-containing protein YqiC